MDTARAGPSGALHRDGMVEAIAFAAERLLVSPEWRDAADEVLARLGQAADVSRAYIVRNTEDGRGRLTSNWLAEWTQPGVLRVMDDPDFRSALWEESGFGRWARLLGSGEVVQGAVVAFPESERTPLELHGAVSLVTLPVFVSGAWWGAIGFDDCVASRDWSDEELAALRASATVLGAAIQRQIVEQQRRAAEEQYRIVVEHIPAVVYVEALEGDIERLYISPQVEAIFGYTPAEWRTTSNFWLDHVHADDRPALIEYDERTNVDRHPFSADYRLLAADGEWRWVHDEATFLEGANGSGFWQGFIVDITDRKLVEEQLARALDAERDAAHRLRSSTR